MQSAATGAWLCGEPHGQVVCNRPEMNAWEEWSTAAGPLPGTLTLKSAHGLYLCVDPAGRVVADRPVGDVWESITFVVPDGVPTSPQSPPEAPGLVPGEVSLTSFHGTQLDVGDLGTVTACRGAVSARHRFTLHPVALHPGRVALQSVATGAWLCGEPSGRVVCDRPEVGPWEVWTLGHGLVPGALTLSSAHGARLVVDPSGSVAAVPVSLGEDLHHGWDSLVAVAASVGPPPSPPEIQHLVDVTVHTLGGLVLHAEPGGSLLAVPREPGLTAAAAAAAPTVFRLHHLRPGVVALQCVATGAWLCGEPSGAVLCHRKDRPGPWEAWMVGVGRDPGSLSLWGAHGRYLGLAPDPASAGTGTSAGPGCPVHACASMCGTRESFTLQAAGPLA